MRRIARAALIAVVAVLAGAGPASAVTITNDVVMLGVNPQGDLNDLDGEVDVGVTYVPTGNDGTVSGCPCEGWGAGAAGPEQFEGRANEDAGNDGYTPVSFVSNATNAVSVVDILRGETPALRLTQDFHPAPTSPNLYEITTTLENLTDAPLTDVRYERVMDWDIEPTATVEFVTVNRGETPPESLLYSDDNGFASTFPFSDRGSEGEDGPSDPATVDADYVDKGPDDHGARFTFAFGDLTAGETKEFFVYYGASGTEADANAAVSAAALEMFSYGQPSTTDGPTLGTPNTFIWGFRAVGGEPVIPPTLTLTPEAGTGSVGESHAVTATLRDSEDAPVPGADIVFAVAGANTASGTTTTGVDGQASFSYAGAAEGADTITACLDSDADGACGASEVTDTATQTWGPAGDTTDPLVTVTAPPDDSLTADATPAIAGTAGTADGDLPAIFVLIFDGPVANGDAVEELGAEANGGEWEVTAPELADGTYTVVAQQSDAAGNSGRSAPATFVVDTTAPDISITAPANGAASEDTTPTIAGTASTGENDSPDINVQVRSGGAVVQDLGAPRTGAGWSVDARPLEPGDYTVTATQADAAGNVGASAAVAFTVSAPPPPPPPPPPPEGTPQPELGKSVVAGTVSGTIRVRLRNGRFRTLGANEEVPLGSTIDATKGRVRLTSVASRAGALQTADFSQGQFLITQTGGSRPITELRLNARLSCGSGSASSSQRRRKVRRLFGDGKGRFRTRARHGAATVRGTAWLTEDRCNSTRFTVRRGSITVRDFVKRKNRVLRRGKSYVIRKKRR